MKLGRQNSTPRTQTPTISAVLSLLKYIMAGGQLLVERGVCRSRELGARFGVLAAARGGGGAVEDRDDLGLLKFAIREPMAPNTAPSPPQGAPSLGRGQEL